MKLQKCSLKENVITTTIVLVVLSLSVFIIPASAADSDNDAIRIYKALYSVDTATTEYVYMPCRGDSMYPTITTGDTVKVRLYTDGTSIVVGDIIVFHAWMVGAYVEGMWIGHRVTAKYKEGDTWYFRTKGDNCLEADGWKVPERAILGKVVSIEHAEHSYEPKKTSTQNKRSYTAPPDTSLPEELPTWVLIIGGFFVGAILAVVDNLKQRKQKSIPKKADLDHVMSYHLVDYDRERARRHQRVRSLRELSRRRFSGALKKRDGKTLVENWRKSIVGLAKLADRNLAVAKKQLETKNHMYAVTSASTSVENIARALIHCFGGKPEPVSGQEEPLRMLSNRFQGDEKTDFERAVDDVACITHNKIALKYMSKHDVQIPLLGETQGKQILESASRIVHLFKRILTDYFAAEIPELRYEACPNCHSLDTLVWSFTEFRVNYQCNTCRYKWTDPRRNVKRWM